MLESLASVLGRCKKISLIVLYSFQCKTIDDARELATMLHNSSADHIVLDYATSGDKGQVTAQA